MDNLWQGLIDQHVKMPMGITAENLAAKYEISREECDAFAIKSQTNWKKGTAVSELFPWRRVNVSRRSLLIASVND